ncbi:MAG TPA: hypothetical protein GX694_11225 [Actinomycetales bacterium]|nr:hypothetical protein [Actinomycetales bacterium]
MKVVITRSARRPGITDDEIRAVLAHPIVRYRVTPRLAPGADVFRAIGDPDSGSIIEVVAENVVGSGIHVFHAMLLTTGVAHEILDVTGGIIDLTGAAARRQRRGGEQ